MTHDIDLIVNLTGENLDRMISFFSPEKFYCPPREVIKIEVARGLRGHANLIHHDSGFKADLYFLGDDPFQLWGLNNAKRLQLTNFSVTVASPEYVIIKKLEYCKEGGSSKHIEDIRGILSTSKSLIDFAILSEFIKERRLEPEWGLVEKSR